MTEKEPPENLPTDRVDIDKVLEITLQMLDEGLEKASLDRRGEWGDLLQSALELGGAAADVATFGFAGNLIDSTRRLAGILKRDLKIGDNQIMHELIVQILRELHRRDQVTEAWKKEIEKRIEPYDESAWEAGAPERVPDYIERTGILEELRKNLVEKGTAGITGVRLTGMGGVGKTYLALKYAEDYEDSYNHVIHVRADIEGDTLRNAILILKRCGVGIPERPMQLDEESAYRATIYSLLRQAFSTGSSLLLLDNVDEESQLEGILPDSASAWHTVITTRDDALLIALPGAPPLLRVDVFSDEELKRFLSDRLRDRNPSEDDLTLLHTLAVEKLGRLPLAVEIAVANIRLFAQDMECTEAIRKLSSSLEKNLKSVMHVPGKKPAEDVQDADARNRRILAAVLGISLRAFEDEKEAWDLLRAVLCFHPASGGRWEMVLDVAGGDKDDMADVLERLRLQHVVQVHMQRNTRRAGLHPLMRETIREKDKEYDSTPYTHRFCMIMAAWMHGIEMQISSDHLETARFMALDEADNLQQAMSHAIDGNWPSVETDDGQSLLGRFGAGLAQWAGMFNWSFSDRRILLQKSLKDAEVHQDFFVQALCHWALGELSYRTNDIEEAHQEYQAALKLFGQQNNHLGEANCLKAIGDVFLHNTDLKEASQKYEEALKLFCQTKSLLGEANCRRAMGDLYVQSADLEGAHEAYEKALSLCHEIEDRLGEANCLQSMGDLCMRTADLAGASNSYEEALPLYRKIGARLGEANCLRSMGDLCVRTADLDGARDSYEEALPLYRKIGERLGEANCLQSMARIEADASKAIELFKKTLRIFRGIDERMGEQATLGYLARCLSKEQLFSESLQATEQALEIGRQIKDTFGISITLKTQVRILQALKEEEAFSATSILIAQAAVASKAPDYQQLAPVLDDFKVKLGESGFEELLELSEKLRAETVARLTEGVEPF